MSNGMTELQYFVWLKDEQKGPYSIAQLAEMWRNGTVNDNTPLWHEGLDDWDSVGAVTPMFPRQGNPFFATPPPLPENYAGGGPNVNALTTQVQQQILFESKKKSAGVACLLNAVIPGAGYMYAGNPLLGIMVFLIATACIPLGFVTLGLAWAFGGLVWMVGLIDGFLCVGRANRALAKKAISGRLR